MAKIKLKHGAPQLRFIRAEVVAGAFDAPQNQAQAEAEAAKFTRVQVEYSLFQISAKS